MNVTNVALTCLMNARRLLVSSLIFVLLALAIWILLLRLATIVPSHKGSFTAVRGLKNVYEVTCSPKNYDHEFAGSLS